MDAPGKAKSATDVSAWHAVAAEEVAKRLVTDIDEGLNAGEASSRLQKYGPNRLPEGKKRGPFMRFLSQFNNILVYVLLGAGFTKLMLTYGLMRRSSSAWLSSTRSSASFRRARPRRRWSRSATCYPRRHGRYAAARRA